MAAVVERHGEGHGALLDRMHGENERNKPSIQPHGLLFVLREQDRDLIIENVSENVTQITGWRLQDLLGSPIDVLLDKLSTKHLKETVAFNELSQPIELRLATYKASGKSASGGSPSPAARSWNGVLHRTSCGLILEAEENTPTLFARGADRTKKIALFGRLQSTSSQAEFCGELAAAIAEMTGYERVCMYKFVEDFNGKVLAEVRARESIESFEGMFFPSTDIPESTRALYMIHRIRMYVDATAEPVEVTPAVNPTARLPVDLNHSILRSMRSCHIQYMKNMGVRASLTISLVVENKLWGLICCHQLSGPKYITYEDRAAIRDVVDFASVLLSHKAETDRRERYLQTRALLEEMASSVPAEERNVAQAVLDARPSLFDIIPCGGLTVAVASGAHVSHGRVPSEPEVQQLARYIRARPQDRVWSTISMSRVMESAAAMKETACGVLAVPVGLGPLESVMWYRPELEYDVVWAGSLKEAAKKGSDGKDYGPRKSFAKFKESVKMTCEPWEGHEKDAALAVRNFLVALYFRGLPDAGMSAEQRRAFETAGYPLVLMDPLSGMLDCNPRFCRALGLGKSDLVGQQFGARLAQEEFRRRVQEAFAEVLSTGEAADVELRVQGGDGRSLECLLFLAPLRAAAGGIAQVIGVAQIAAVLESAFSLHAAASTYAPGAEAAGDIQRAATAGSAPGGAAGAGAGEEGERGANMAAAIEAKRRFLTKLGAELEQRENASRQSSTGALFGPYAPTAPESPLASRSPRPPPRGTCSRRRGAARPRSAAPPPSTPSPSTSTARRSARDAPAAGRPGAGPEGPAPRGGPAPGDPIPEGDEAAAMGEGAEGEALEGAEGAEGEEAAPRQPLAPRPTMNPLQVLAYSVKSVQPKAVAKQVQLSLTTKGAFPEVVYGDAAAVHQLLRHLLTESVKFVSSGRISLLATLETVKGFRAGSVPHPRLTLRLDVADTGIGLLRSDIRSLQGAFSALMEHWQS
eukprot:tig00001067_g6776.t1